MKKILVALVAFSILIGGCKKYEDSYLRPSLPTAAYFASGANYTRTVIVGEGMKFKIGAAMSGEIENKEDRTVQFQIGNVLYKTSATDNKILLPANFYNSNQLGGTITATIPKGEFLGYFTVVMDSVNFLNDPVSLLGHYTLPVKIVGTSLSKVTPGLDTVRVSVKYMTHVDGYYFHKSVIKKEVGGVILENKTQIDSSKSEVDNHTWRLLTQGPFDVKATTAVNSIISGLSFNLNVNANKVVTYSSISGQPVVTPEGTNTYDSKSRDFKLNFNYKKATVPDTIYHVSTELIFRNRLVDGINETREYLKYFNK